MKDDIINAGATYIDEEVVSDGRIFTTALQRYGSMAKAAIDYVKDNKNKNYENSYVIKPGVASMLYIKIK